MVGVFVVAFLLFFFVPVIEFVAPLCTTGFHHDYESLSFSLFNIGEVYVLGQFAWMAQGFPYCI